MSRSFLAAVVALVVLAAGAGPSAGATGEERGVTAAAVGEQRVFLPLVATDTPVLVQGPALHDVRWYVAKYSSPTTFTCNLDRAVPGFSPGLDGRLCVRFRVEPPPGRAFVLRAALNRDGALVAEATRSVQASGEYEIAFDAPAPAGTYRMHLFVNGAPAGAAEVVVTGEFPEAGDFRWFGAKSLGAGKLGCDDAKPAVEFAPDGPLCVRFSLRRLPAGEQRVLFRLRHEGFPVIALLLTVTGPGTVEQVLWRPAPAGNYAAEVTLGDSIIGGGFVTLGGGSALPFSWTGALSFDRGEGATYGMFDRVVLCYAVRPGNPFEVQLYRKNAGAPEVFVLRRGDDGTGECLALKAGEDLGIERTGRVEFRAVFFVNGSAVAQAESHIFVQ